MGRRAEVALYRIYMVDDTHRYVRIVRSGRGWAPKIQPAGKPGAFYLRYEKNGRRTEQEARKKGLDASPETVVPSPPDRKNPPRTHLTIYCKKGRAHQDRTSPCQ